MQSSERAVLDYERGGVLGKTTPTTLMLWGPPAVPSRTEDLGPLFLPCGSASIQRQTTLSLLSQKHAGSNSDHLDHPGEPSVRGRNGNVHSGAGSISQNHGAWN